MSTLTLERENNPFYDAKDPELDAEATNILIDYSGIPATQLIAHVRSIRDKAWAKSPYPCIGLYKFIEFNIQHALQYSDVLQRTRNGHTLLDAGCCFGHAIRKLVVDGALAENLTGLELEQDLIDLGYELFRDKETLKSELIAGDVFAPSACGLEDHSFDIVHAGALLHLFTWDEQVEALSSIVRLLKPKSGSLIFGRQTGVAVPGPMKFPNTKSGEIYRNSPTTFKELVQTVAEKTNVGLEVAIDFLREVEWLDDTRDGWKLLNFCIVVK